MKEDLKDIELFIDFCRAPYNFEHESDAKSYKELSNKIEHLIKAYKDLKEIEENHRKENGKLREKVKQLEEENQQLEAIKDEAIRRYNLESIPTSLVKEKIEELKNKSGGNVFHIQQTINAEIRLLEELLEKR